MNDLFTNQLTNIVSEPIGTGKTLDGIVEILWKEGDSEESVNHGHQGCLVSGERRGQESCQCWWAYERF